MRKHWLALVAFLVAVAFVAEVSAAEKNYDPGVSDTEIKIGQQSQCAMFVHTLISSPSTTRLTGGRSSIRFLNAV